MRQRTYFLLVLVIHGITADWSNAQIQLDRFFPPAVTAGSTTIQAEGKFPNWPVTIRSDRSDVTLSAAEKSGQIQVTVAPDSPPGITWIRMYDSSSVSALVPLVIDRQPGMAESEPNNQLVEADALTDAAWFYGRIEKSGDVDAFLVPLKKEQVLVASLLANQILKSPMDAVMQLVDERGNVILQSDDERGLDPQFVYHSTTDQSVYIRVFAFPEAPNSTIGYAGSNTYVYQLQLATDGWVDHVLPLVAGGDSALPTQRFGWNLDAEQTTKSQRSADWKAVSLFAENAAGWSYQQTGLSIDSHLFDQDQIDQPTQATVPFSFSGHIDRPGEVDTVEFNVQQDQTYMLQVHSREFGFALDSLIQLFDATSGETLAENNDQQRREYDSRIQYTAKTDAQVRLSITDALGGSGPRHAYTITVARATPEIHLAIEDDHFIVAADKSIEIPVSIDRSRGANEKLRVYAAGLPAGVTVEPVVSEPKGDSSKSVKLKLVANQAAAFQGPIQILGQRLDDQSQPTGDPIMAKLRLRGLVDISSFWLTVAQP